MKKKHRDKPRVATATLDPLDWTELRQQAHRMLDDLFDSMATIHEQPVWQAIPDEVRGRFHEDLPAKPTALAEVHKAFLSSIVPYTARNAHPGFLGWVQGGGTAVGMLAEMLAAGLNANLGGRDQMPLEVEHQVTEWMRRLFGFPAGASGLFVTGTSMANLLAVIVARDSQLGFDVRLHGIDQTSKKLTAYASTAAHASLARALDFCGLGSQALRPVAVDSRQRIQLNSLAEAIAADRAAGLTPFLVIGTAGTVDTGAIDDLAGIAALCAQEQLWFHVDGAYGALAILAPELAPRLKGIERADSLAFDFHKWAQVPYDAGFLLVRDGALHQQAFASSCNYLTREPRGMAAGSPWPCDLGVDLSRGFRALKTWATLKVYGTAAIAAVIRQTCALARYLESRIRMTPELELMAAVELNIVCFRYRFRAHAEAAAGELCDRLNREIVVQLQQGGKVAPSTTVIQGRVAIRAAVVNHRTTQAEMDALVAATLAKGRELEPAPLPKPATNSKWPPWLAREWQLRALDQQLAGVPALKREQEAALRVRRANLLAQMGRMGDAIAEHCKVVQLEPAHLENLLQLGHLLVTTGKRKAAQMVFAEAVRYHPQNAVCQVNLGSTLLQGDDPQGARMHYEAALRIDPDFPPAHGGMYYALTQLGEPEEAARHQRLSFGKKNLFQSPYRGDGPPIHVLLLVSSTGGNVPIEKLLDDRVFATCVVVADFYDRNLPLPAHRFVFNGIGDPDIARDALVAAEHLTGLTRMPVLNAPSKVMRTGRCDHARRLAGVGGLIVPATAMFPVQVLAGSDGASALGERGFAFPLLLRVPGFHMGKHFVRVDGPEALAATVAELPHYGKPGAELLVIEYLDARGRDGSFRKYRVMMVGGELYPLHLAISENWKIHYFSADMADRPDHRAEEAEFLADMPGVLGSRAMGALRRLAAELGLDYGGVDFALDPDGNLLLFEANATMVVEHPSGDERWNYRRAAVDHIHAAVRKLLLTSAGLVEEAGKEANLPLTIAG